MLGHPKRAVRRFCLTIKNVAELIIDDDQPRPPLACPKCGTTFSQGSIRIFEDRADCPKCHLSSGLSDLDALAKQAARSPQLLKGIVVSERGSNWAVDVTLRSWSAIFAWAFALYSAVFVVLFSEDGFVLLFGLFIPHLCADAMMRTFGRISIQLGESTNLVILSGIGPIRRKKQLHWPGLRSVTLKSRRYGRGGIRKTIVLNADCVVEFGELMNDDQRAWMAEFLVKRSSQFDPSLDPSSRPEPSPYQ